MRARWCLIIGSHAFRDVLIDALAIIVDGVRRVPRLKRNDIQG